MLPITQASTTGLQPRDLTLDVSLGLLGTSRDLAGLLSNRCYTTLIIVIVMEGGALWVLISLNAFSLCIYMHIFTLMYLCHPRYLMRSPYHGCHVVASTQKMTRTK